MKIYALFFAIFASFFPLLGLAQEVSWQTPREFIINEITQTQSLAIEATEEATKEPFEEPIPAPLTPPEILPPTPPPEPLPEEVIEPPLEEVQAYEITPKFAKIIETVLDGSIIDDGGENISKPVTITLPEEVLPKIEKTLPPQIAAFYLTTEEFLAMRGQDKAPQLVLNYDISTQKTGMLWPVTTKVQIILGDDYAAMKTEPVRGAQITRIYDFKLARLLTISSKSGQKNANTNFDNISLYAPIYRNIRTVRRATQGGQVRTITLGGGKKLDAFWVESAMSWAVNPSKTALTIKESQASLTVYKDKKTVFSAEFSQGAYSRGKFKQALLGFAHHEWPVHPQILDAFAKYSSPPKTFTMLSYSPSAIEGETQTWTLVDSHETKDKFPLPANALSISQRQPISPLVFIIGQAVKGEAFGGAQTKAELESDFATADENGDDYALWLIGQRYNNYTGKCDQDPYVWLCVRLAEFEEKYGFGENEVKPDRPLFKFIQSVRLAKDSAKRTEVLELLEPFLSDPDVPAIILYTAAMARAKIKASELINQNIIALNPEKLLHAALAKDPYDPNIYLGLAQISAANEAYEASWDFYDVLRTGAANLGAVEYKIDTVENKLRTDAPGYFAQTK